MASMRAVAKAVLTGAAAVAIAGSGPALAVAAGTPPPAGLARSASSQPPGVSVTVDRDGARLVAGRDITYTITVRHSGDRPADLTVRASLPPWLTQVAADRDGEVADASVRWSLTAVPDRPARVRVTGQYARPDRDEQANGPTRVALTACVLDGADGRPAVCATDIAQLDAPTPALIRWLAVAAVLAATGGAAFHQWRRSRPSAGPDPVATAT